MRRVVVVLLQLEARVGHVVDPHVDPDFSPGVTDLSARSATLKTSVNWLKTRYSPSAGGFSAVSETHCSVSTMFRKPRVWPPFPYTVSGWPITACTAKRFSAVPKSSS